MQQRDVLEVETPILARYGNTDPAIDSFYTAEQVGIFESKLWLRTSPEFFHKRLLVELGTDVFEIAKVFRAGEISARHNPEFTMLEYYRIGMDEFELMTELSELMRQLSVAFDLSPWPVRSIRFRDWFLRELDLDILRPDLARLRQLLQTHGMHSELDFDASLDFLRSTVLEPKLPKECWSFVHGFPASQAALAQLSSDGLSARRFELFAAGFELANGYFELCDADLQSHRFAADLSKRSQRRQPAVPADVEFLSALKLGMPSCAGVAVGLDRLLMVLLGSDRISDVLAFPLSS